MAMRNLILFMMRAFTALLPLSLAIFTLIAGYSAYPVVNPWFTDKFLMNMWFEPFDVHRKNINMMLVDQIYPDPCVIRKEGGTTKPETYKMIPRIGTPRAVKAYKVTPDGHLTEGTPFHVIPTTQQN